jgi:signal transduction histidine kinase
VNEAAQRIEPAGRDSRDRPARERAAVLPGGTGAASLWTMVLRQSARAWMAGVDGVTIFATRAMGLTVGEPLPEKLRSGYRQAIETGWEVRERVDLDGAAAEILHFPIFDETGAMLAVAGIVGEARPTASDDPLGRVALEAALEDAERRVAQLEAALADAHQANQRHTGFFAEMSHELRTPLNAIVGFADAALHEVRGPLPAAYREYVEHIHGAGRHLVELVDSLLDVARLEGGQTEIDMRPISARLLVNEARAMIALRAEQSGIDIAEVRVPHDFLVEGDPIRARQILVNLLWNALKFTPAGKSIGVEAAAREPGHVDLTVWDQGIGIDPADQARVFEAFYQAPGQSFRPSVHGVGLGLAISRQLAQLMGGDILLHSEPGQGSRFTVRLKRLDGAPG